MVSLSQLPGRRAFSDAAVVQQQSQDDSQVDIQSENARLGIDTEFS